MDPGVVGAITGPIGAVTGILALGWNVYVSLRDRARVYFEMNIGMNVQMAGMPSLGRPFTPGKYTGTARVVNTGRRPITLELVGFDLDNKGQAVIPMLGLPAELAEGKSFSWPIELGELRKVIAQNGGKTPKNAWIRDASGKHHHGKIQKQLLEAMLGRGEWGQLPD